jgi:hypothetical protein
MSKELKLLICPFCGNKPQLSDGYEGPRIRCENTECETQPSTDNYENEVDAIAAWNRRSPYRQLILEEAAKVADEMAVNRARVSSAAAYASRSIADRIRSLSHPDKEKGT